MIWGFFSIGDVYPATHIAPDANKIIQHCQNIVCSGDMLIPARMVMRQQMTGAWRALQAGGAQRHGTPGGAGDRFQQRWPQFGPRRQAAAAYRGLRVAGLERNP